MFKRVLPPMALAAMLWACGDFGGAGRLQDADRFVALELDTTFD